MDRVVRSQGERLLGELGDSLVTRRAAVGEPERHLFTQVTCVPLEAKHREPEYMTFGRSNLSISADASPPELIRFRPLQASPGLSLLGEQNSVVLSHTSDEQKSECQGSRTMKAQDHPHARRRRKERQASPSK